MRISIIIPAFNEEKLLSTTLASIKIAAKSFTTHGFETELIVCNNNSTDSTAQIAEAAGAIVVFEPINQISRARNCGAAAASGEWLVFIDADSTPSAELLAEAAACMKEGKVLAGGSTIRLDSANRIGNIITYLWNLWSRFTHCFAGSFIFCEAAAFREVGGFTTELFASEEVDLSKRLKKLAHQKSKRIVILHHYPILTSDRKLRLYSPREHLRFLSRMILAGGGTLRSREECSNWYDGRR